MTQLIPEAAMPKSNRFYVIRDSDNKPMIFSLGTQGTMYLVKIDPTTTKNTLVDLNAKFGLSRNVVALNVTQDQDLTLYLVFAEEGATGEGSIVHVVKPVKPSDCDWIGSTDLKPYLFKSNVQRNIIVTRIFLGTGDDGNGYPLLALVYSNVDGSLPPNTEVARITVNTAAKTWDYLPKYSLPENARAMDDICVASVRGTRGLFTLYRIQGKQTLAFVGFPGKYGVSMMVDLIVPEGAQSLATFANDDGFTDLLVGGAKGLYYLNDDGCSTSGNAPVLITPEADAFLKGVSQLHVARAPNRLSVWARNRTNDVVYQQFSNISLSPSAAVTYKAIPLLTKKEGGGVFAALLDPKTHLQTLFILGDGGQLRMLEQTAETGAWQPPRSLDVPSTKKHGEFTSYTTHVTVTDSNGSSLIGETLLLCAASVQDISVNNTIFEIGPDGQSVKLDSMGSLTLFSRSPNLDAVIFTLKDLPGASVLGREYTIDPAQKVKDTLSKISSPEGLKNVKLEDGSKLLDSATKPAAVEKASAAFGRLGGHLNSMEGGVASNSAVYNGWANQNHGESMLWEAWQWVSQKFDEFSDAVICFAKGAWRFVVDIAGRIFNFVIDTASQVLNAMHWLLEDVLGIPISKIIAFVGFLFNWSDILFTRDVIVEMVNVGLDWAEESVHLLGDYVDEFFDDIKEKVENLTVPDDIKNKRRSADDARKEKNPQQKSMSNHPGGNWSNYQMEHGGVKKAKPMGEEGKDDGFDLIKDVLDPTLENFTATIDKISASLKALADPKSSLTIGDILLMIGGDIASAFIEGTRIVASAFIKSFASILRTIKDILNFKIEIPLLSSLYRKISGGHDLTVLDAVALLLAVPSTVLYKIMHKRSPKEMVDPEPHPLSELYGKTPPPNWGVSAFAAQENSLLPSYNASFALQAPMHDAKHSMIAATPTEPHIPVWPWSKIVWAYKKRAELIPIVVLIGNVFSSFTCLGTVMAVDGDYVALWWQRLMLAKDVILFLVTVPVHPWSPKRPSPILRLVSWGLGCIPVIARAKKASKKTWALCALGSGSLQAILDIIVVVNEWNATEEEFPNRPDTLLMSFHTANVVFASTAKIVLSIATWMDGGNIYFNVIGFSASGLATVMAIVIYGIECGEGIHHPVVSLLGSS
ncbi:hypothetical protein C0991_002923 [Blastosporella zonata]|nr:hypothetical protein C0991_002923 [Blastosporella zonata]